MAVVETDEKKGRKGFQASFAGRIGNTEAKLAGVLVPGNRTNLPVESELLFQENGPGAVFWRIALK
jgi:hypothetical protein